MSVRLFGDPVLERRASSVPSGLHLSRLLRRMREAMQALHGVGIAAPQLGVPARVVWIDIDGIGPLVDPVLVGQSEEGTIEWEGCLSAPGIQVAVWRPGWVDFEALGPAGKRVNARVSDWAARVLCHEVDHLDGRLIVHRLEPQRQEQIRASFSGS